MRFRRRAIAWRGDDVSVIATLYSATGWLDEYPGGYTVVYVITLQKVLSSLLVAVFVLGTITCPCAAVAGDADTGSHAHHEQHPTAPDDSDCPHSECENDCDSLSVVIPDETALLSSTGQLELADADAIEAAPIAYPHLTTSVTSTGPPYRASAFFADTPIRRHDVLTI